MTIYRLGDVEPTIHPSAFIHPAAVVIGAVQIGAQSSIWPGAVLRADFGKIIVGDRTSVQDGTVIHAAQQWPTIIGADCVVGHNAHLEGAVIEDGCLIGSMSTSLQRVVVRHNSLVAASALLTEGVIVPANSRALGAPTRVLAHADPERFASVLRAGVEQYVRNAERLSSVEPAHRLRAG